MVSKCDGVDLKLHRCLQVWCSESFFYMCNFHGFQKSELPHGTRLTSSGIFGWHINLDAPHKLCHGRNAACVGLGSSGESSH